MTLKAISVWVTTLAIMTCVCGANAQQSQQVTTTQAARTGGMVELDLPEKLPLQVLIDYVGERNGINFLYEENVGKTQVTLKTPKSVPADSLQLLLESVLRLKNLAIYDTEVPGMKRIAMVTQLTEIAVPVGPEFNTDAAARPTEVVTRLLRLKHVSGPQIEKALKPFLSSTSATIALLSDPSAIMVTDYATNMKRLDGMVALLDQPGPQPRVEFVELENLDTREGSRHLTTMLKAREKVRGGPGARQSTLTVIPIDRTNQLVFIGLDTEVADAMAILKTIDIPLKLTTQIYRFQATSAEQVDEIVQAAIGELAVGREYKATVTTETNMLVVSATAPIHAKIAALTETLDQVPADSQSPMRFYRLENAKAAEVLITLQGIERDMGLDDVSMDGVHGDDAESGTGAIYAGPTEQEVNTPAGLRTATPLSPAPVDLDTTRILADEPTNTIIIVARPAMHPLYEKLIRRLDRRRPQVLIEATVFTLDTTDGFSLGVEFSKSTDADGGSLLNFTQFGLSKVDAATGALTLVPGVGFNGAILGSDIADIVIRALETDTRVRVVSRPTLLINDNAKGTLASEVEEPFATVNVNVQGPTTTLGGYSKAGTQITVEPQISQGDHLKLDYEITLSSFGEDDSETLPPSRQSNTIKSQATIPDGYTIIVGGLTRDDFTQTVNRVPILGNIPVVEHLFSNRDTTDRKTTLFVFIRAVILRDDKFRDLKLLSSDAVARAGINDAFPTAEPTLIR